MTFELINLGVDRSDYFQGSGISRTRFNHIATGIGKSYHSALVDALDQISLSGELSEDEHQSIYRAIVGTDETVTVEDEEEDTYHYASICYTTGKAVL